MQRVLIAVSCITLLIAHRARAQASSNIVTLSGGFAFSADSARPVRQKHQLVLLWRDDAITGTMLDLACSISRRDPATWRTLRVGSDDATRRLDRGARRYAPLLKQLLNSTVDTAWTDATGTFAFHGVPAGSYYVFTELRNDGPQLLQWWRHVSIDGAADIRTTFYSDRARREQFCRPQPAVADSMTHPDAYFESQVESPAHLSGRETPPRYPPELRAAGDEADIDVTFVVDTTGRADMSTFTVVSATNPQFMPAVRTAVARDTFSPAEIAGRKVRQVMPYVATFTISY